MASRLGDQTARLAGRVTLNPMYHVDPIGTLLFPALMIFGPLFGGGTLGGFLIGWAKPTPVMTRNFKKIVRDDSLVTLAGPVSNLLLALLATLALGGMIIALGHIPIRDSFQSNIAGFETLCELAIQVNLALFIFNLLPIPPLDGSHILRHFLPYKFLNMYDNMGMFSYILMIMVGGPVVRFFMTPLMNVIYAILNRL